MNNGGFAKVARVLRNNDVYAMIEHEFGCIDKKAICQFINDLVDQYEYCDKI